MKKLPKLLDTDREFPISSKKEKRKKIREKEPNKETKAGRKIDRMSSSLVLSLYKIALKQFNKGEEAHQRKKVPPRLTTASVTALGTIFSSY